MATTYNYSVTSDFGGNINIKQLGDTIASESGITINLTGILIDGDNVDIIFDAALSAGEHTTLDGIISSHDSNEIKGKYIFYIITPKKDSIKTSSYTNTVLFKYDGSNNVGTINYIEIIAYMDSGITSYSARVYDKTNNQVIAEATGLTNTVEAINDLGTISNVPTDQAIFELQMKRVGGSGNKNVYIESISIYHNN